MEPTGKTKISHSDSINYQACHRQVLTTDWFLPASLPRLPKNQNKILILLMSCTYLQSHQQH
jgi:hypothetical protein